MSIIVVTRSETFYFSTLVTRGETFFCFQLQVSNSKWENRSLTFELVTRREI